jgi:hypothetical protein
LRFIVAPHIVQDLGLNLYTNLPRVLVEFIANSYDADAKCAKIIMDKTQIEKAREVLKKEWELEKVKNPSDTRLAELTLPDSVKIIIEDSGHGMSRNDLQTKFLVAGRRRREEENQKGCSPGNRVLMGRKGLGKLAGFGVAQHVMVISKIESESHATSISLDYKELIKVTNTNEIPISEDRLADGAGLGASGTRIILSRLLYEPMKSKLETIEHQAADHFAQIDPTDFRIELNGKAIEPTQRKHVFAWPQPEKPVSELIKSEYTTEDGRKFQFEYRLRFTEDRASLIGKDRGVRVYAHKRLAAAPSLLDADTNMHGFRMTDYLDGVVYADFIDDQPEDYIATDRQSLRWESPLLAPMYDQLSNEIKQACLARQKKRDETMQAEVEKDTFTMGAIKEADLNKRETTAAIKIAGAISSLHKKGFEDDTYRSQFKQVIRGLGQGEILSTLASLANLQNPTLDRVVAEVTRLTADELDGFYQYVRGRLDGIGALKKIVDSVNFKLNKNEKQLHDLLNRCPWLIDPTFFEFLTSNLAEETLFKQLEKQLGIGSQISSTYDPNVADEQDAGGSNKRPDLVFLLGNSDLKKIIIIELKAPNTPLYGEHYRQLQGYVYNTREWLNQRKTLTAQVEGILIGSWGKIDSKADDIKWLRQEIQEKHNQGDFRVFGIDEILMNSERVHRGLLDARARAESAAESASK